MLAFDNLQFPFDPLLCKHVRCTVAPLHTFHCILQQQLLIGIPVSGKGFLILDLLKVHVKRALPQKPVCIGEELW
ncbi:hypothetical protein D3C72_696960 [compost metagenome]